MNSSAAEPLDWSGSAPPRVSWVPPGEDTGLGEEAVYLCRMAGLELDPWQEMVLRASLRERDGRWAAFEIGLEVPRQNGKGVDLTARELVGLFLIGEELITHSAHQFDTSLEAFRRLLEVIEGTPDFSRRVKRVSKSHGEEGIELVTGQRVRFRTRTKRSGRGFSGDLLIFDEAMELPESAVAALLFTLSARPNPQLWYTGSAVDQETHDEGVAFARIRDRGFKGGDPSLAYFCWSAASGDPDDDDPGKVPVAVAANPANWAAANPGLGRRLSPTVIAAEQRSVAARTFAVERLGIGDWPRLDIGESVIAPEVWLALRDHSSEVFGPVGFAFDVSPDRSRSSIGVAGYRSDGKLHVEVVDRRSGTGWLPDRLAELVDRHEVVGPPEYDAAGPAASLLPALDDAGVKVKPVTASEHAQGCGQFFDAVEQDQLRHLGAGDLDAAVQGAEKRTLGDAWAWSRKSSAVDISPLVAVTLALRGLVSTGPIDRSLYRLEFM